MPIKEAASNNNGKVGAIDSNSRPARVNTMPMGREYGMGLRSVKCPIKGCRIEAVIWKVSVSKPI